MLNPSSEEPARAPTPKSGRAFSFWIGALALCLYFVLALRVMGEGDSAEVTLVLATAGVAHPTGYPLYTLAGHGFVVLVRALGAGAAHAANLWSAVGAALALALTARLALRLAPGAAPAVLPFAVAAVLLLGAESAFFRAATQAEVYSWQVAWTVGLLGWAVGARRRLVAIAGDESARVGGVAFVWGLWAGAGLAHHRTSIFFVLPITWLLARDLLRARTHAGPAVLAALAGAALPLTSHAHIAWRAAHPAAFQWPLLEPGWDGLMAHVRGDLYGVYLVSARGPAASELGPVALAVLIAGMAALAWRARRDRAERGLLVAAWLGAAGSCAFALFYGAPEPGVYVLPAFAVGVAALAATGAEFAARAPRPLAWGLAAVLAAAPIAAISVRSEVEHSARVASVDREVRAAFAALPFDRGVVTWRSDSHVRLRAYQMLEGVKPGVHVLDPAILTWPAGRRQASGRLGFDPLAGLELKEEADLDAVPRNIARVSSLPVVDFARWWGGR